MKLDSTYQRRKSQPYSLAHSSSFTINSLISIQLLVTHIPLPPKACLSTAIGGNRRTGLRGGYPVTGLSPPCLPPFSRGCTRGCTRGTRRLVDSSCEARCARRLIHPSSFFGRACVRRILCNEEGGMQLLTRESFRVFIGEKWRRSIFF